MIKSLLSLCLLLALLPAAHAQLGFNSPTGVTPRQDFELYPRNSFLVQQKYRYTTVDPAANVLNLSCVAVPPIITAAAGTLKEPTGDANYMPSLAYTCMQSLIVNGAIGFEVIFEDLDTENAPLAGSDVLVITDALGNERTFSGNTLPAPQFFPSNNLIFHFQADGDANVGRGFRLRWRAVYKEAASPMFDNTFGSVMQFDVENSTFTAGFQNKALSQYSIALGFNNRTTAASSIAIGRENENKNTNTYTFGDNNSVLGRNSFAIGRQNSLLGVSSIAVGNGNTLNTGYPLSANTMAFGTSLVVGNDYATGLGRQNTVSGNTALATGYLNTASGDYSTAMGHRMNTNNQAGAFMIGDTDPLGQGTTLVGFPDQFVARFRNGYFLMTSGNTTRTGVVIGAGQNAWSAISDSTRKERFLPMNHAEVLRKINAMKLTSWNYKGQREIRHYGPMAQDFYAAFGHDALGQVGCDTLINSHDFAGVTFAAVQALVRENEQLRVETQSFASQLHNLQSQLRDSQAETQRVASLQNETNNRLQILERAMLTRRERVAMRKTKP